MKNCRDCSYWLFCDPADNFAETCEDYTEDEEVKEDICLFLLPDKEFGDEIKKKEKRNDSRKTS